MFWNLQCWWISMLPNITWELIFTYALQGTRSPKKQLQKGNRARAIAINGLNQIWAMFFLQQINASMHCINVPTVVFICTCWLKYTQGTGFVDTTLGQVLDHCVMKKYLSLTFLFITSCLKDLIESTGMQQRHLVVCNLGTLDVLWNRLAVVDKRIKAKI